MTGQRLKVCFDELNLNHSYSYCMSAVQRYKTVVTDKLVLCENTRAEHFDRRSVFYCYSAWFLWSCWDWKKLRLWMSICRAWWVSRPSLRRPSNLPNSANQKRWVFFLSFSFFFFSISSVYVLFIYFIIWKRKITVMLWLGERLKIGFK